MNKEFLHMQKLAGIITEGEYNAKMNEQEEDIAGFLNQHKDETFKNVLKPMFEKVLQGEDLDMENISLFDKYKNLNWEQGTEEEYEYAKLDIDDVLELENGEELFLATGFQASLNPFTEEITDDPEYNVQETTVGGKKVYYFTFNF
jgi:hypothetical protein